MEDNRAQCRKVLCPSCLTVLFEPPGVDVYECPVCSIHLQAKRAASKIQKELLPPPSNGLIDETSGQISLQYDGTEDCMPIEEYSRQKGPTSQSEVVMVPENIETNVPTQQAHSATSVAITSEDRFASLDSTSIAEKDMGVGMQSSLTTDGKEFYSGSRGSEFAGEGEVYKDHVMQQQGLDEKSENSGNDNGLATSCVEENVIFCQCGGREEVFEEGNKSNEMSKIQSESQIMQHNDNELSFKYIASSLKSSVIPEGKKKTQRLGKLALEVSKVKCEMSTSQHPSVEFPHSTKERLDDHESYSSYSGSVSNGDSDSEFDFPSAKAVNIHVSKPSETFQTKLAGPHQLEWQVGDDLQKIKKDQELNSSMIESVEHEGKIASIANAQANAQASMRNMTTEDGLPINEDKNAPSTLAEPETTVSVLSHGPGEKTYINEGVAEEAVTYKSVERENEDSTADSLNESSRRLFSERKNELLELSGADTDPMHHLKQESILNEYSNPMDSTGPSTLTNVSQRESCLVEENAEVLNAVSNLALNVSTFRLCDNKVGTLDGVKREEDSAALLNEAGEAGSTNAQSDLQKELSIKLEWRHAHDPYYEKGQLHTEEAELLDVSDLKLPRKRNISSYAEESMKSKNVDRFQYQENIHDVDLYPPLQSSLEESFRMHERDAQADSIRAGSCLYAQDSQTDLFMDGQISKNADAFGVSPASPYSYGSNASFDGSRSFGNSACSYQAPPACSLMLPIATHGQLCSHKIHHPVCPVCMPHYHGQNSAVQPFPAPSCLQCLGAMGHYQRWPGMGHHHCSFHAQGSCMLCPSSNCYAPQFAHMHNPSLTSTKASRSSRSSVNKPKKYPPLPEERNAPYVVCRQCNDILEVPVCISSTSRVQKLRCGACGTVSKFSVNKNIQKPFSAKLRSSAVSSASERSSPSFEFMAKKREQTIPDVGKITDSSYGRHFLSQNQRGSLSSRHPTGEHHAFQGNPMFETEPTQNEYDPNSPIARKNHNSKDDFFVKHLSRKNEMQSSYNLYSGFATSSSTLLVSSAVDKGLVKSDNTSLHCVGDEKEEGLDFGAPRPSDGDSLDQRSPEKFESVDQSLQRSSFREAKASICEIQPEFGSERKTTDQIKLRPTLYTLFNQESTKFRITLENGDRFATSTPGFMYLVPKSSANKPLNHKAMSREKLFSPLNLKAQDFIRNGPSHIAAMLAGSWKHHTRN